MNILHIISGDIFAGAEMQVFQTLQALKSSHARLNITCLLFNHGILEMKLNDIGISTFIIDEKHYNLLSIISKTSRILSSIKPDLIHVHRAKEHAVGFFAQLITLKIRPLFRTVHGLSGKSFHKSFIRRIKWYFASKIDLYLIRCLSNVIIAVSDDMLQYLKTLKVNSKIVKIYNSLNLKDYNLANLNETIPVIKSKYSVLQRFWVGTAARLAGPKNLGIFIDAAYLINSLYPNKFKFSIFGEGPLRDDLQSKINKLHLCDSFTLHGFEQHIVPVIASLDLFILCSLHEGLPIALLEAMALGKPVICTEVGGMREIITSHKNGILIPVDNAESLANEIELLSRDASLRQTLGSNAKEFIHNSFSINDLTDKLLHQYINFSRSSDL